MMPQREASEPQHEQADPTYGGYEGEPGYTYQQFDTPNQRPFHDQPAAKVYVHTSDNKNVLRLVAMGMAFVALLSLAVVCLIFVGGLGGWISFCAACLAIFIVAVVAIDKIK